MKKFLLALSFLIGAATVSVAQNPPTKTVTKTTSSTKDTVRTKKDGTPDKRYKENKTTTTTVVTPTKKDGTPDMRYKTNKTEVKKTTKKTTTTTP